MNPSFSQQQNKKAEILTDQEIVKAILDCDEFITRQFFYIKCYPLFKSISERYYTDCATCHELINEIYTYIMIPQKKTGLSKLQTFGFRCSFTMWIKIVSENYCRQLYTKRISLDREIDMGSDRFMPNEDSLTEETRNFEEEDLNKILDMMPNQRYRDLIQFRYVEEKTNEETAEMLSVTMANYYNMHKRAKNQYYEILRKEGLL